MSLKSIKESKEYEISKRNPIDFKDVLKDTKTMDDRINSKVREYELRRLKVVEDNTPLKVYRKIR